MNFIKPLDLQTIFVNVFAGSMEIFFFVAFIAIAALAATFRMPNMIFMLMMAVFGILMANYFGGLYFLVVVISGLAVFYGIGSVMKR